MNKFQLDCLSFNDLLLLRDNINEVLKEKRKSLRVKKRRALSQSTDDIEIFTSGEIESFNASKILSIPNNKSRKFTNCSEYFHALIKQDWSHIYNVGDQEIKYYVYAHVDPTSKIFIQKKELGGNYGGTPFYIGKGSGLRAWDLKRNQGHGKKLNEVMSKAYGSTDIVKILFDGLTEPKAFEIEAKLIYFFGTIYDKSLKKQGVLFNLEIPILPIFEGEMKKFHQSQLIESHGEMQCSI